MNITDRVILYIIACVGCIIIGYILSYRKEKK